jgi:SAM-dependent methyltransferase
MTDHTHKEGYIVDPETAEEAERLRIQGRYFDAQLGLFPKELPDLTTVEGGFDVLDIGCASGGLACAVATKYRSSINVIGIDISENMILAAKARSIANKLPNASFKTMDATIYPFPFQDSSFDLVNARAICAFMQVTGWPALVQECSRLLRPGGYLCFVESDAQCWSSSPALAEFYRFGHLALKANGNSWDKEGIGIVVRLPSFLRQAGFDVLSMDTYRIDIGREFPEGYKMGVKDYKILLRDVIPFCVKAGIATEEQLKELYVQAMKEIEEPDFNAFWLFTRIVGRKV